MGRLAVRDAEAHSRSYRILCTNATSATFHDFVRVLSSLGTKNILMETKKKQVIFENIIRFSFIEERIAVKFHRAFYSQILIKI